MNNVAPARAAAAEILGKIEAERSFSSILLPAFEKDLTGRDRALCHELTLGVLRKKILLDRVIESLTGKPVAKFDLQVIVALHLGLYQILFLDRVPAYSAINESVNLVYRARKRSAAGLVNAVLRRASREGLPKFLFADEFERISVETSHPEWLIRHWANRFGIGQAEEIAASNNDAPGIAFRLTARFFRREAEERRRILDKIAGANPRSSDLVADCFVIERADEQMIELAESGDIYFQEEGSQLVAQAVALSDGESFLDVCAAPGSKISNAAAAIERRGSQMPAGSQSLERIEVRFPDGAPIPKVRRPQMFVAGDLHPHRLEVLRENLVRQGCGDIHIVAFDAEAALPFSDECFDMVLVDAPCSGTGTIRHNPEIRYFLDFSDLADLACKQLRIVRNASKMVKCGGRLIYSTCSLEKEENEEVVECFLRENPSFQLVSPALSKGLLTPDGFIRTLPQRDGIDGFFVAMFEKRLAFG